MKSKRLLLTLLLALVVPWAAMAQCEISYTLNDSYGDGWNGGQMIVTDVTTSTQLADLTISSGSSATGTIPVTSGHEISFAYTPGSYAYENSWTIYDPNGATLWTGTGNGGDYSYTYNAVCPSCFTPTGLAATLTPGDATVATLNWTAGNSETNWVLQIATNDGFTAGLLTYNVSGTPSKDLTGLTAEQKLYARVKADCGGGDVSEWSNVISFTPSNTLTIPITGSSSEAATTYYLPTHTNYDFSYTQQIYTATEIGQNGTIKSIAFKGSRAGTRTLDIYMVNTDKESFSSVTDVIPIAEATLVFSGDVTFTANEWTTIELDGDGFEYEGSNLAVIVDDNSGNYYGSTTWQAFNANNQGLYYYQDNTDINPSSPSANTNVLGNYKNQIQLGILPNPFPKPKNLEVADLHPTRATLSWEAPTTATPTGYEYQYKKSSVMDWPTNWMSSGTYTNVSLTLEVYTEYDFRVRATYAGGESDPVGTSFRTLPNCATPTNFVATITPGQGTKATLTWVKGYDEDAWVLEYALDEYFSSGVQQVTTGFVVEGNNITCNLTGLTPETQYFAHVRSDCGGDTYSQYSATIDFTPTNYADYTYGLTATGTNSYIPFYGYYANDNRTVSQYIIPATELGDIAGGTIRSLTYYTSSTPNWGDATVFVYVKEVDYTTFASASESALEDWTTMTQVYNGSLTISEGKMTITFAQPYSYNGGNLMIGFKMDQTGSSASVSWTSVGGSYGAPYTGLYGYYYSYWGEMSYYGNSAYPKTTLNYLPTAYPRVAEVITGTITGTSAQLSWTAPSENVTGYRYQYKKAGQDWPTAWTNTTATSVTLSPLTATTDYEFQVVALYGSVASAATTKSFSTPCPESYPVPYTYDFESETPFNCWTIATGSNVVRSDGYAYANSGTYKMIFFGTQTNEIAMPSFAVATNTLRLEFWVRPEDYRNSDCGSLAIGYYNSSNEFVALKTYAYNTSTGKYDGWESSDYKKEKIDFNEADVPADANIIFRQFGTTEDWYWFVDDVKVKPIPTCEDVDNVHFVDYTNHSATIAWDAATGQSAWQIAYKAGANFDPNDATELATATIVDATNPHLFDMSLEANATYYMYVRANCTASSDGYGDWSDSYAIFTTAEATPTPGSFTASNLASQRVDLKWVKGGGDMEAGWELYYVKSTTAPEPPTASTTPTETVNTMPTPEAPYELTGLDPESTYFIWVRSKYLWNNTTSYSDWVALDGGSFTTKPSCPTPENVEASYITSVEALISWVGSVDVTDYTVEYGEEGTYSVNETVDFSGLAPAGYSSEGVLPEGWKRYNSDAGYMPHVSNKASCSDIDEFGDDNNYLLMTQNKSTNQYLFAIMPQISDLATFEFKYVYESTNCGVLSIGYVTNNLDYSTYHLLQTPTKSRTVQTYKLTATDIATINANNGYVTFRYEGTSTTWYSVGIDDIVYKGGTYTPGATQTKTTYDQQTIIDGLTPNKTYNVRVKSNCSTDGWSTYTSFTTLPDGTKVFTNAATDGKWATDGNWSPVNAPALTDDVILRANATIENGCVAEANSIDLNGNTLTIADGGQLKTNTAVTATVKKNITGYGAANENTYQGYYLIGQPLSDYISSGANVAATGMTTGKFDLYQWNYGASDDLEWRNYEDYGFSLNNGQGYLYANESNVELTFTGSVLANNTDVEKTSSYAGTDYEFNGWSLWANPFVCNAYVINANSDLSFYRMNAAGNGFIAATGAIKPMEGIFVHATANSQTFEFTRNAPSASPGQGNLNINMAQVVNTRDEQPATDNAIVRFDGGSTLEKFSFRQGSSKVYIPQGNKDYAVVSAEAQGELPLNFQAEKNSRYTLSFTAEDVDFSYLHLIDNLTGADVDLLATPSYTFNARMTDYASRFRIVFATGSSADSDSFGFVNASGNLCIYGIEGETTLQVFDAMGRMLSSETFSGSYEKKIDGASGVYVIRLINGDNVRTQKIVVE